MTLSKPFESQICPDCGLPLVLRAQKKYPVFVQLLFALSFIQFLFFYSSLKAQPYRLWGWTALQIFLGILLTRGRILAQKKVYYCVRCAAALR